MELVHAGSWEIEKPCPVPSRKKVSLQLRITSWLTRPAVPLPARPLAAAAA